MSRELIQEQIYNLYTEIREANRYAIEYNGIDGRKKRSFSALGDVAKFLKDRDEGVEYRRKGYLQGEFAMFIFHGFGWEDILTGPYNDENSQYRTDLETTNQMVWKFKPLKGPNWEHVCTGVWSLYVGDVEDKYDTSAVIHMIGDRIRDASYGGANTAKYLNHDQLTDLASVKAELERLVKAGK